jgi:hypothetical protein
MHSRFFFVRHFTIARRHRLCCDSSRDLRRRLTMRTLLVRAGLPLGAGFIVSAEDHAGFLRLARLREDAMDIEANSLRGHRSPWNSASSNPGVSSTRGDGAFIEWTRGPSSRRRVGGIGLIAREARREGARVILSDVSATALAGHTT